MYLAKFNSEGHRITSVVKGVHFKDEAGKQRYLDDGFVEISDEDQALYTSPSAEYIRDPETGKPVPAPVYQPTKDEKANALFNSCQADLKEIDAQIVNAIIIKDTELVEELRQEREERVAEYEAALNELEGGEE